MRRALGWYFEQGSPWVTYSLSVDFNGAAKYLETVRKSLPGVTVQHLLSACVGRVLRDVPEANRRLVGGRSLPVAKVGIAMPVNLLGQTGGRSELALAILEDAGGRSLRDITEESGRIVQRERRGESANPWVGSLFHVGEMLPDSILRGSLVVFSWLMEIPAFANEFYRRIPFTTFVTNVGAAVKTTGPGIPKVLVRGGSIHLPVRPIHFATFWGVGAVQEEVVSKNGKAQVRQMLPLVLSFDHRVLDGVKAGELVLRFAALLKAPEKAFGADGTTPG